MDDIIFWTTSYALTGGLIHYYIHDIVYTYTIGKDNNYNSILNTGFFIGGGLGLIKAYYSSKK